MKHIASLLTLCGLAALPALAQSHFTGFVGGGFSQPINPLGARLDNGWNISAGAGVTNKHAGLMLDFMFNDFPITRTSLNQVGAPNGSARFWAVTLDPVFHVTSEGPVDLYVTGGGGIYHRQVEFTQPALSTATFFDPWFGFYPASFVTNQVIGSYGVYKGGVDGGVGLSFNLGSSHVKAFAEARFHHMFTRGVDSNMVPVTFGLRW